jgi:hypothetical protein
MCRLETTENGRKPAKITLSKADLIMLSLDQVKPISNIRIVLFQLRPLPDSRHVNE